jgi:Flp pilus assembly protein TadG
VTCRQTGRTTRSGQSLVEFAFALPVLLLLLLGIIDLGRAFYVREQVSDAARAALRTALQASQQSTANAACASGGKVTVVLPASNASIADIARAAAVADSPTGAAAGTNLAGATLTITWHCTDGAAVTNTTNGGITDPSDPRSDSVDVVVQYPLALLYPVIQHVAGPSVTITAHEIGRVEY